MPRMKFEHMELTFPRGGLSQDVRDEIDAFYGDVFGWASTSLTNPEAGTFHMLQMDDQAILLAEVDDPMRLSPQEFGIGPGQTTSIPHLAMHCETREQVEDMLEGCKRHQKKDSRVKIYDLPVWEPGTMFRRELQPLAERAFYMNYLLPIYFELVYLEWDPGCEPEKTWRYV